jgi:post-segregation antitoxin (ccd killing protein)
LVEPQNLDEAIFLIGVGHCSKAIAKLCVECGLFVTVVDDRNELMKDLPENVSAVAQTTPAEFIRNREWQQDEALVIASRNYEIDRDALIAALAIQGIDYIGMIGSRRKVRPVFDQLKENGNQGRTPRAGLRPSRARHWRRFSGRNCGQRPGRNSGCLEKTKGRAFADGYPSVTFWGQRSSRDQVSSDAEPPSCLYATLIKAIPSAYGDG